MTRPIWAARHLRHTGTVSNNKILRRNKILFQFGICENKPNMWIMISTPKVDYEYGNCWKENMFCQYLHFQYSNILACLVDGDDTGCKTNLYTI